MSLTRAEMEVAAARAATYPAERGYTFFADMVDCDAYEAGERLIRSQGLEHG